MCKTRNCSNFWLLCHSLQLQEWDPCSKPSQNYSRTYSLHVEVFQILVLLAWFSWHNWKLDRLTVVGRARAILLTRGSWWAFDDGCLNEKNITKISFLEQMDNRFWFRMKNYVDVGTSKFGRIDSTAFIDFYSTCIFFSCIFVHFVSKTTHTHKNLLRAL